VSPKKKKVAQLVEEKTQETAVEVPTTEDTATGLRAKPSEEISIEPIIPIPKMPAKVKRVARDWGIDLGAIEQSFQSLNNYLQTVEARLQVMAKKEDLQPAFEKVIENLRQKQMAQAQQMATTAGGQGQGGGQGVGIGSLGSLGQLGQLLLGGGGGQDPEMAGLGKELIRASIDRMKREAGYAEKIVDAVVSKISAKAVGAIVE